jgi:hypothetical protein
VVLSSHGKFDCQGEIYAAIIDYIVLIAAQVFFSFFFRQPKRKKVVRVAKLKRRGGRRSDVSMANHADNHDETVLEAGDDTEDITPAEREIMDGADDHLDGNGAEGAESTAGAVADSIDAAKAAHDDAAVHSIHMQAIKVAHAQGIVMTDKERDIALGLFPKVCFANPS